MFVPFTARGLYKPFAFITWLMGLAGILSICAYAQGGPPLLTDDPGTPGTGNWEINLGYTLDRTADTHTYTVPVLDANYGWGSRIQLNYQVPYLFVSNQGQPLQSGLGNSQVAVKWRFFQGQSWNLSTYPRFEFSNPTESVNRGLVDRGPNFLLPLEITKKVGPVDVNFETGYWFSRHNSDQDILGLALGHQATKKLEVLGELYHIGDVRGGNNDNTFDGGGRYEFHHGLLFLFMAGRSFSAPSSGQSQFIGYFGLQIQIERHHPEEPLPPATPIPSSSH